MNNLEQADAMLMLLLNSGREAPNEDRFVLGHEDVMTMLELIRARVMAGGEEAE